jgi:hypothetical protein
MKYICKRHLRERENMIEIQSDNKDIVNIEVE